jgi:hypothetical protein
MEGEVIDGDKQVTLLRRLRVDLFVDCFVSI